MSTKLPIIDIAPLSSPKAGAVEIKAFCFDTYGTVCDFYAPFKAAFEKLATEKSVTVDTAALALRWRREYAISTYIQAATGSPYRPLMEIQRENLIKIITEDFPAPVSDSEIDAMTQTWQHLSPWPDTVEGLHALKKIATIAPLSNGGFAEMTALAENANLPWDTLTGSEVAQNYKPHASIYLISIAKLGLKPEEVCMVAAHQVDLTYAAGHGMQTAFIRRPDEFGGQVKPANPEPGVMYLDHAELHVEGDWTYVADSFIELADQVKANQQV